jgi:hypothetical protein
VCALVGVATGNFGHTTIVDGRVEWDAFLLTGFTFGAAGIAVAVAGDRGQTARLAIAAIGALAAAAAGIFLAERGALIFGVLTWLLIAPMVNRTVEAGTRRTIAQVAAALFCIVAWLCAARMSIYVPLGNWLGGSHETNGLHTSIAFVAILVLAWAAIFRVTLPAARWAYVTLDVLTVATMAFICTRRDIGLHEAVHISSFIGPAQLVKQGGWLLWDVPSQYGFGNILAIAALPFHDIYACLFTLNAVLELISGTLMFMIFRAALPSLAGSISAALIAIASTFLVDGVYFVGIGSEHYPSVGPVRFLWCFVLMALVAWWYVCSKSRATTRIALCAMSIAWVCAFVWAAESAVYNSLLMLVSYPLIVLSSYRGLAAVRWLLLPPALLAGTLLFIDAIYHVALGHGPDWYAFIEYGLAYKGGYGSMALSFLGSAPAIVLIFCILASIALLTIALRCTRGIPVVLAACAIQWSTASYFVGRSADNNVLNLVPVDATAIGLALLVLAREPLGDVSRLLLRAVLLPYLVLYIGLGTTSNDMHRNLPYGLFPNVFGHLYDDYPIVPNSALAVLQNAGLTPSSPVIWESTWSAPRWPNGDGIDAHLWTVAYPPIILTVLPVARQAVYIDRFFARRPQDGYLLLNRHLAPHDPDLIPLLGKHYSTPVAAANADYVLLHMVPLKPLQ